MTRGRPPGPFCWADMETALLRWVIRSTDIPQERINVYAPRDDGPAKGPSPTAHIQLLSLESGSQVLEQKVPSIVSYRLQVIAGAGDVGVDFFPGFAVLGTRITVSAAGGDTIEQTAAALLTELGNELPSGYSASLDPDNAGALLLVGSAQEPMYAASASVPALLTSTVTVPRFPVLVLKQYVLVWRIAFRAFDVSGNAMAVNYVPRCELTRQRWLDPDMNRLGFENAGTALSTAVTPIDREESLSVLDVRYIGFMAAALEAPAMRAASTTLITS